MPLHRSGSSGDTFLFTSYLSTQDPGWNSSIGYGTTAAWPPVAGTAGTPAAAGESNSTAMLNACADTPGCIGYNGISYLSEALAGHLGYASLKNNADAYTLPTAAAIQAAVASFVSLTPPNETISMIDGPAPAGYPIVNYEYAVVKAVQPDAAKASALRAFLRWVITTGNGSSYLKDLGFQPLSGPLVTLGEQQIAEIGSWPPRSPGSPGGPRRPPRARARRAAVPGGSHAVTGLNTPGTLRALLASLVLLSLAWGAFGGWVATVHSSAAAVPGHRRRAAQPRRQADVPGDRRRGRDDHRGVPRQLPAAARPAAALPAATSRRRPRTCPGCAPAATARRRTARSPR